MRALAGRAGRVRTGRRSRPGAGSWLIGAACGLPVLSRPRVGLRDRPAGDRRRAAEGRSRHRPRPVARPDGVAATRAPVDGGRGGLVEDLESRNGTFVNGQPIVDKRKLGAGDVVRIGETSLLLAGERDPTHTISLDSAEVPPSAPSGSGGRGERSRRRSFPMAARQGRRVGWPFSTPCRLSSARRAGWRCSSRPSSSARWRPSPEQTRGGRFWSGAPPAGCCSRPICPPARTPSA